MRDCWLNERRGRVGEKESEVAEITEEIQAKTLHFRLRNGVVRCVVAPQVAPVVVQKSHSCLPCPRTSTGRTIEG